MANLTTIPIVDINPSSIQTVILEHSSKVRVIASPPNVPSWATFSSEYLRAIVEQSAYTSRYVFLDLPRDPDIISSIADQLSGLILVLGSEPSSLRIAQELTLYLGNLGLHDRLSTILIHRSMTEHQYVDAGMIADQLGCLVLGIIPFKPDLYLRAEYEQSPMLLHTQSSSDSVIFEKIGSRLLNYIDTLEQFQKKTLFQSRHLA
jgi:MinD-like ATPase involved in chromosome partitioning or flagellar assembly